MSAIKRCWAYWRQNVALAKERHEMSFLVVFALWQVVYGACQYWGFFAHGFISEGYSKALDVAEVISIGTFVTWCFLWLPFQRHEAQEKRHAEEKKRLEDALEQARHDHQKQIEDLSQKTVTVAFQQAASNGKQHVLAELRGLLLRLENRCRDVTNEDDNKFLKTCDSKDQVSQSLVDDVAVYLQVHLSPEDARFFQDPSEIKYPSGVINSVPIVPFLIRCKMMGNAMRGIGPYDDWVVAKTALEHYVSRLRQLIKKMESNAP